MFKLLLAVLTSTTLFAFSNGGEDKEFNIVKLHDYRQISISEREIPDDKLNNQFGSKEIFEIQFKDQDYYQVEKVFRESPYGSTKETQIYFSNGDENYLVSTLEYTNDNIISRQNDLSQATKISKLPFNAK